MIVLRKVKGRLVACIRAARRRIVPALPELGTVFAVMLMAKFGRFARVGVLGLVIGSMSFRHLLGSVGAPGAGANGFYRTITIDHTKVGATDSSNFSVPVTGTYSYLATVANGGKVQNANGYDVGFFSDSGLTTRLKHETVIYTAASGLVEYWVKVPTASHTADTVIYMAYGNTSITTDQSDHSNVWDANFQCVKHYGDGTTLSVADSTSNARNGTKSVNGLGLATGTPTATAGKINGGISCSPNQNEYSAINAHAYTAGTLAFWVTPVSNSGQTGLFEWSSNVSTQPFPQDGNPFILVQNNSGTLQFYVDGGYRDTSQTLTTNTAYLLHVTFSIPGGGTASTWKFYKNGALLSTYTGSATPANQGAADLATVGCGYNGWTTAKYDEMRVSNAVRSADWITAEYNSQNSPSTFYAVGSEVAA